jgi:hypothetical protein
MNLHYFFRLLTTVDYLLCHNESPGVSQNLQSLKAIRQNDNVTKSIFNVQYPTLLILADLVNVMEIGTFRFDPQLDVWCDVCKRE